MSNFPLNQPGAVVRIGSGKVLYNVLGTNADSTIRIESQNTGKVTSIHPTRIYLVQEAPAPEPQEEPVEETSAYAKAVLFALNKLQKHVYAGTVSKTKKAKTRKLNRRQKASRKANR